MKNTDAPSVANAQEKGQMQGVAAGASGSGPSVRDITEDEEYYKFVESMVPHCRCTAQPRPCDGVLAGGLCDNLHDDRKSLAYEEDDRRWEEDPMGLGGV